MQQDGPNDEQLRRIIRRARIDPPAPQTPPHGRPWSPMGLVPVWLWVIMLLVLLVLLL